MNEVGANDQGRSPGTLLCVANFSTDAGYAWWLMERFWSVLAHLAVDRGGDAILASPRIRGLSNVLSSAPLTVLEETIPTGWGSPPRACLQFLRDHKVRTIYLTDRQYWSPAYAFFRACGVQSIIIHDHVPGERPKPPAWKLRMKKTAQLLQWCGADLYIGVSEFIYNRMIQIGGLPPRRCTFVRNGVPPSPDSDTVDIRAELELPHGAPVVVSVGRAHPYKGIDFILDCALHLTKRPGMENVQFVHIGGGPELGRLRQKSVEMGLDGRFRLTGVRSDVRSLLPSCDVAFHASHGEAFSLAILEFMAAGLPVVVPNHCGNPEAVRHGRTGLLYQPGDLRDAVGSLETLLNDPPRRLRMGEASASRAEHEFSLERMDARFKKVVFPAVRL